MEILAVIVGIVVFLISLAIVRGARKLFMKLIGANFILVNPVTTIVLTMFLTMFIMQFIGL